MIAQLFVSGRSTVPLTCNNKDEPPGWWNTAGGSDPSNRFRRRRAGVSLPIEERFWRYAAKVESGCWEWTGHRTKDNYGRFQFRGQATGAHRVAYEFAHGAIPKGMVVMHACDNPPCINPAHLSVGTFRDNAIDCVQKGRHARVGNGGYNKRLTHCKSGHEFTPENTRVTVVRGYETRTCRACKREWAARKALRLSQRPDHKHVARPRWGRPGPGDAQRQGEVMSDRTVHATLADGSVLARYDRAGKWYREWPEGAGIPARQIKLPEAVALACESSSTVRFDRPGGGAFDTRVRQVLR